MYMCGLFGLEIRFKLACNNYVLANNYVRVELPEPLSLSYPTLLQRYGCYLCLDKRVYRYLRGSTGRTISTR